MVTSVRLGKTCRILKRARGDAFQRFVALLASAYLVVANLECQLIERSSPIRKTGPILGVPPSCAEALQKAGVGLLTLANNHLLDHGEAGLRHTMAVCRQTGIATVGAGANLQEGVCPWV